MAFNSQAIFSKVTISTVLFSAAAVAVISAEAITLSEESLMLAVNTPPYLLPPMTTEEVLQLGVNEIETGEALALPDTNETSPLLKGNTVSAPACVLYPVILPVES